MSLVHIQASPKQLSKLRNGRKVRIRAPKPSEGEGFNLYVHPDRYSVINQTFNKGLGMEIQLTPEEILGNRQISPEYHRRVKQEQGTMSGVGIFGKKFDKLVEKTVGKKTKNAIYKAADQLKDPIKKHIDTLAEHAPELGATALSGLALAAGQPELVPLAGMAGHHLGKALGKTSAKVAKDYLDRPSYYQDKFHSNVGGTKSNMATTLAGQMSQDKFLDHLNSELGTNMGALAKANIGSALANSQLASMFPEPVSLNDMPDSYARYQGVKGKGLWAGGTAPPSAGGSLRRSAGIVGTRGTLLKNHAKLPPALQSQPSGVNFQYQFTLPPSYQKFHQGEGTGLYLGNARSR
ncbi:MAG: hypothetical protein EB127_02285 [Alphaproteobacteria bacterium]|nr:hypothetical protein [Alphaproteobacteria bacterium]